MIYLLVKQQCVEIDIVMNIQVFCESDAYYATYNHVYKYIQESCTCDFESAFMLISKIKSQSQLLGIVK